jgi:hypothetical protein
VVIDFAVGIGVLVLACVHTHHLCTNLTTNESENWDRYQYLQVVPASISVTSIIIINIQV